MRRILLALGLALLVYVSVRLGLREIAGMLVDLRWAIVPALALYGGHQAARALALTYSVARHGTLGFADALRIRLSGEAVEFTTFTGPLLAEPTKAWLLQKRGLDIAEGLAATLTEYLGASMAASLMAIAGLSYVLGALEAVGSIRVAAIFVFATVMAFDVLFVIGIGGRVHILGTVIRNLASLWPHNNVLTRELPMFAVAEDLLIESLRSPRRLARIVSLELAAQALLVLELWVLMSALGLHPGIGRVVLMEGVTKFINSAYFLVPGQLGVAEATYAVIFSTFGLSAAAGVTISFARRLRSLLTAFIGLTALSMLTRPAGPRPVG